ncbi:MAG TPA: hypothetical protein VGF95_14325 [Solirubrobacteraceae bacterium]|jgi:hypothetical protein
MRAIWKFHLPHHGEAEIAMPPGAEVLGVGVQRGGRIVAWASVDTGSVGRPEQLTFVVRMTGESFEPVEGERFVGTFQLDDGDYVGHVFVRGGR